MTHWNLRVIEDTTDLKNIYYYVAEVYYDAAGKPIMHTENGVRLLSESYGILREYYTMCNEAFTRPVINIKEFDK